MKLGAFLLGGACGVAAAVIISKRRPGMTALANAAVGRLWSGAGKGMGLGGSRHKEGEKDHKSVSAANSTPNANGEDTWSKLESIVSSDPGLKKETEKIFDESVSKVIQSH